MGGDLETRSLTAKGRQCGPTFAPENGFFLVRYVNAQLLALIFTLAAPVIIVTSVSAALFPALTMILS
jgi:hypothetical protein